MIGAKPAPVPPPIIPAVIETASAPSAFCVSSLDFQDRTGS